MDTDKQRTFSYGERRKFSAIEKYAIGLRLQVVVDALRQLQSDFADGALTVLELGCGYHANNLYYLKSLLAWLNIFDEEEIRDHKSYLTGEGIYALAGDASLAVREHRTFSLGMNQVAFLAYETMEL